MNNLVRFNLSSLSELHGGRALETFQEATKRAVLDCLERPGDKRARKVVMQMTIVPVPLIQGNTIDCDSAEGSFQIKCTIPQWETESINFGVQNDGNLIFNPDSPRDHKLATPLFDNE